MTTKKATVKRKAVARRSTSAPAVQQPTGAAILLAAASNPDTDAEKMERLYVMYDKEEVKEAKKAYNASMTEVQKSIPAIKKTCENKQTSSNYADLQIILNAIRPVYTEHGFSLSGSEGECPHEGMIRVYLDVSHTGGDERRFMYDNPIDSAGIKGNVNKTPTHGKASGVSYALRYLTNLVFMLEFTNADDDGNAAGKPPVEVITDQQALEIDAMITDNDVDKEAFLKWLKKAVWVDAIADIPVDWFPAVIKTIQGVIKSKGAAA